MALIPDRSALETMRRADLQKLCKDHGLKANMKSEALIDMLLDTAQADPSTRLNRRPVSVRSASRDSTSSNTRGRVGSMIIHDISEDEGDAGVAEPEGGMEEIPKQEENGSQLAAADPSATSGPATRTRHAKEKVYKLGVGRPKALGGSGPRKLSKGPPASFSRGKRAKTSVSIEPSQEAIQEEEEEVAPTTLTHDAMPVDEMPVAGPSGTTHDSTPSHGVVSSTEKKDSAPQLQVYVDNLVNPLRAELQTLHSELQRLMAQASDAENLKTTVSQLTNEVAALRLHSSHAEQEVKMLKEQINFLQTPRSEARAFPAMDTAEDGIDNSRSQTVIASSSLAGSVGEMSTAVTQTTLGKRQRESVDSNITGVIDMGQADNLSEGELANQVVRPTRKRLKLAEREAGGERSSSEVQAAVDTELVEDDDELPERVPAPRGPGFTIFSGPEEPPDDGRPNTHLSDIFGHTSVTPPNGSQIPTATANALENQTPLTGGPFSFNFANSIFQPTTSTPAAQPPTPTQAYSAFPVNIPAPEPPTSPTPAGPSGVGARLGIAPGTRPARPPSTTGRPSSRAAHSRTQQATAGTSRGPDGFVSFPPIAESSTQGQTVNPAHLGLGMNMGLPGYVPLPMPPDTPAPPMKRTMYGTELETDTRFGDFGVEGVATGFWTGAAPRF